MVSGHIARGSVNGQRHKKTLSIIWSVSSHNSASSKGKLCCRQKNHQKAASLSAVLCAVQLNRLSSKSHCTYSKYRICCRVCDVQRAIAHTTSTEYVVECAMSHSNKLWRIEVPSLREVFKLLT